MTSVEWEPVERKPAEAARLEAEIGRQAPGAQVKLTLKEGVWLVRALGPSATCQRGSEFTARDLSALVAEILTDNDQPASVFKRR